MTTLSATVRFEDRAHGQAVVYVVSSLCFYNVAITKEKVTVIGPGVEREFELRGSEAEDQGDIPEGLTYKGQALIAVTLLEEER